MSLTPSRSVRSRWAALAVVCLGMMLTFLNITATVSAVPAIESSLGADSATTVWLPSMYTVVVASLVLSAGTFGDVIGRRTAFIIGAATMAAGSFATYAAPTSGWFLTAQAITGIGAALVLPNSLAVVSASFTDQKERTEAISIWAACSGLGLAFGPLSAGALLGTFSWNALYLVNATAAVAVALVSAFVVPQSRVPGARLDFPGLITGVIAIGAVTYWIIDGSHSGFGSPRALLAIAVFACSLAAFLVIETRVHAPMLRLDLFRSVSFSVVMLITTAALFGFTGLSLISILFFERVEDFSAWTAGLRLFALTGTYIVVSALAPRLLPRLGYKMLLASGFVIAAVGAALLLRVEPGRSGNTMTAAFVVMGIGIGTLIAPATAAAMDSVSTELQGMASGTTNLFRQFGSVLGISGLGSIFASRVAAQPEYGSTDDALTTAFHECAFMAAIIFVLFAVLTVLFVNRKSPQRAKR